MNFPEDVKFVAVEGVIGAGKSTLAKILADKSRGELIQEVVEENPFLEKFYESPEAYAFQTQLFFLLSRHKQLDKNIHQQDLFHPITIADYTLDKDRIFAGLNLKEQELGMYETVANALRQETIQPDFIIYLQANVDILMQRIQKRGRPMERNMSPDYLKSLSELYTHHFFSVSDCPVLIVNTDHIDFVENPKDLEELLAVIESCPPGTTFYNPQSLQ